MTAHFRILGSLATLAVAIAVTASPATALGPSHATGQPNQSCQETTVTPGNAASAPGSAFNPDGNAGTHYAGQQPQNSKNPTSVSQYDVACANQTARVARQS